MDSYVITGKLHDDEWFCSIFKHEKLMNSTRPGLAFHDNRLDKAVMSEKLFTQFLTGVWTRALKVDSPLQNGAV